MGKITIGVEHAAIGFSDRRKTVRFFDLRGRPSHTLNAASRRLAGGALRLLSRERHEACSLQIHRRHLA
jgi:hypothetical protein